MSAVDGGVMGVEEGRGGGWLIGFGGRDCGRLKRARGRWMHLLWQLFEAYAGLIRTRIDHASRDRRGDC